MPVIKVRNGSQNSSTSSLCRSCRWAHLMKDDSGREAVFCQCIPNIKPILVKVSECSSYDNKGAPSLDDMRRTAWVLESSDNSARFGFIPYRKWRAKHPNDDLDNGPCGPAR